LIAALVQPGGGARNVSSYRELRIVMADASASELLAVNQQLLDAIARGDWKTYHELSTLTAFEPEAQSQLVEGLGFHKFYFDLGADANPRHTTMASPHVRVMGDVAVVAYVRLVQSLDGAGSPRVSHHEETRVWQRREGRWRHVHFHRSTS
jgi:calcium/calmodulin-dependent protein kinase (CaM kinase) II